MVTAATPAQAAAHAFVTGCVKRGITASQAAVPPEGQLATVRGLWADIAQAATDAATEGSLRACGYTLADVGRFLEAEAAAPQPHTAPDSQERPATSLEDAMLANIDGLNGLVRDILQSLPDTADEQEWRDRAGTLDVHDPDGQPYRAYTGEDL